jgi:hypothetical protein
MPCTAFPGRTRYGFESVVTHEFPGSTVEYVYSHILRERPEMRMPVSTVEGEGREGWRSRGVAEIAIAVVVEWTVISVEGGGGVSNYGCV